VTELQRGNPSLTPFAINMSAIQTPLTRLLGITKNHCTVNVYVLKHQFQVSELLLCSLQWPVRAEVRLPAKFRLPAASVSWHQVRHDPCQCGSMSMS
jgi:hypothetical protein